MTREARRGEKRHQVLLEPGHSFTSPKVSKTWDWQLPLNWAPSALLHKFHDLCKSCDLWSKPQIMWSMEQIHKSHCFHESCDLWFSSHKSCDLWCKSTNHMICGNHTICDANPQITSCDLWKSCNLWCESTDHVICENHAICDANPQITWFVKQQFVHLSLTCVLFCQHRPVHCPFWFFANLILCLLWKAALPIFKTVDFGASNLSPQTFHPFPTSMLFVSIHLQSSMSLADVWLERLLVTCLGVFCVVL